MSHNRQMLKPVMLGSRSRTSGGRDRFPRPFFEEFSDGIRSACYGELQSLVDVDMALPAKSSIDSSVAEQNGLHLIDRQNKKDRGAEQHENRGWW